MGIAFSLAPGASVLETTKRIKTELASLSRFFPPGLKYAFADDRAPIVEKSISSVVRTLIESIVLVVTVMFLFLQNMRATFIPTIAVPVVLLGVFAVLAVLGYSINTLTMFGLVLAIGLLVDDTIVVVENTERLIRMEGLSPLDAALKSMKQITGALIGVAVVISAVFLPMAFMSGSTGVIYRQFAVTIVASMVLSVIVAIVLTPALSATMLEQGRRGNASKGFFGAFNRCLTLVISRYCAAVRTIFQHPLRWLCVFSVAAAACAALFVKLPTAFLPDEDQGVLYVDVQLPAGATFERTAEVLKDIEHYFRVEEKDAVQSVLTVKGWGFSGTGQGSAMVILQFKDWDERGKEQSVFNVMARAEKHLNRIAGADIFLMAPPAVMELGTSSGFDLELMDRSSQGHAKLMQAKDALLEDLNKHPDISYARYGGLDDAEEYKLDVSTDKAGSMLLTKAEINSAFSAYWGGQYVNDFTDKGRTKKVYVQAEPFARSNIDDLSRYYVRNSASEMVPLTSFTTARSCMSSPKLTRYQGMPSVSIQGEASEGRSSGDAMNAVMEAVRNVPSGFDAAWTGLSYQEVAASSQAPLLYAISVIVVFLSLAALYESWSVPLAVLLAAPIGILCALIGMHLRGMNNDIYFQIALLTVLGLSAKNSILIVEFAKTLHESGRDAVSAALEAARLRFLPILMTSLCFILGVIPLTISSGAGSGAQNALGTAVVCGMLGSTVFGIFFTPLFFVVITNLFSRRKAKTDVDASDDHARAKASPLD